MFDHLHKAEWNLDTAHIGRHVLVFDSVESTNTVAADLADPAADGLVVIARHQTAGRGRFGRVWQSRPDTGLLMSVVLYPPAELRRPAVLTAWAAVAAAEAVFALTGAQAKVKWPNDLLVRGKKVCGILIEQSRAVVIGIGLNLNQTVEEFAAAGLPDATSLGVLAGRTIEHRVAAEVLIRRLDAGYDRLLTGERAAVEADWAGRMGLVGKMVSVELTDGSTIPGRLHELGFDGLAVDEDGIVRVIMPETVAHVRAV